MPSITYYNIQTFSTYGSRAEHAIVMMIIYNEPFGIWLFVAGIIYKIKKLMKLYISY